MSNTEHLADRGCTPCRGGVPPLNRHDCARLSRQLDVRWHVVDDHHLTREFHFPDFATALAFVNSVGEIAEAEGHHPDVSLSYGKVTFEIYTHAIDGLSESDFILAAKIDRLPR